MENWTCAHFMKRDVQSCGIYRGMGLMSHTMELKERVVEAGLRSEVKICEQQFGFTQRKRTSDLIFVLRMFVEKVRRSCIGSL